MKIYNTMHKEKEEFVPLEEGKVSIYACGPTVYDFFHIGNARAFILFDTLRRFLEYKGYEVTLVQNFTDIDDKMIAKAEMMDMTVAELADQYIKEYYIDAHSLNIQDPTHAPRATDHIQQIIALIEELIEKGLAYSVNGDVYYSAKKFQNYGELSGQHLEDLSAGMRVSVDELKEDPLDFALWKAQKPNEPAWDSPWGKGRPGWHIECSAMSMEYLGDSFDIHGGGQDLIFPHHENEIAQSEGASGKPFARYWMHNGYLNIDNRKMSKSRGNFFTVRDITKEYDPMAVRMLLQSAHYRSPINFSEELMEAQTNALERITNAVFHLKQIVAVNEEDISEREQEFLDYLPQYRENFIEAMEDDLNTADALSNVFDLVRQANIIYREKGSAQGAQSVINMIKELMGILGIDVEVAEEIPSEILQLAADREQARQEKQWEKADALRDKITSAGYSLEDTPQGPLVKPQS